MATRMILIRHGNTGYPTGMYVGSTDSPLAEGALEKARELGERLKPEGVDAIYTSQLNRAVKTGEVIGQALGIRLSGNLKGFNEIDFGEWEMMWRGDVKEKYPEEYEKRMCNLWTYTGHNVESWTQVRERVMPVVQELLKKHEGETFAVVTHGVTMRIVYAVLLGLTPGEVNKNEYDFLCALFFKKDSGKIELEKEWGAE